LRRIIRIAADGAIGIANAKMTAANRKLIQILPRLTPTRCGVSDQAVLLATELADAFEIKTQFVVLNSKERCELPFQVIHSAPSRLLDECISLTGGEEGYVLAHVSGYAYSADGAPEALARSIQQLKSSGRFRIAAYFHELFAKGTPWTSAFWHSKRQKDAVRRIAQVCDLLATNVGLSVNWLERQRIEANARPVRLLPVFSAAGEAKEPIQTSKREPTMVAFGLPATRKRAYKELANSANMLSELGVRKILDIGPDAGADAEVDGIPVTRYGVLPVTELTAILSSARFGFLSYPPNCLAKSSVFAAYCAHGVIPVVGTPFHGELDGLRDGAQLLTPRTSRAMQWPDLDRCSLSAWNWHKGHRVRVHAETYARWMEGFATNPG